jgi:predicted kinase
MDAPAKCAVSVSRRIPACDRLGRLETSGCVSTESVTGCVLVTGMPGAGKTTVTTLAARLMPRAARVGGDDVNAMIGSGFVWFMGEPPEEALRQDELCNRNMCSLAANFIDFGFAVLMDTVLADRSELDFFIALLSPRPVRLIVLDPGIEVCKTRNAARASHEQFEFDEYERLDAEMRREFGDIGWWLDTSDLSAEATAEKMLAELSSGTVALLPGWNAWLRKLHRD